MRTWLKHMIIFLIPTIYAYLLPNIYALHFTNRVPFRCSALHNTPATTETASITAPENVIPSKSFIHDELRPYAMKLHTRDQAPKEGQQKAQVPFTQWQPTRLGYLRFLVDSLKVYQTFEQIVHDYKILLPFTNTGLERSNALLEDIQWLLQYDPTLGTTAPSCGEAGETYSTILKQMAKESIPRFMCHYYNHYFAHTAGGRMIGKKMSEKLLENKELKFYQWDGDMKVLLDNTSKKIDTLALSWSEEEKTACLEETMNCFRYGGSLMTYMKPSAPPSETA